MKQIFVLIFSFMLVGCVDPNGVIQSENRQPPPPKPDSEQALFQISRAKDLSHYSVNLNEDGLQLMGVTAKIVTDRDTGRSKGFRVMSYKLFSVTGQPTPVGEASRGLLQVSCLEGRDDDCDGIMKEMARDLATGQASGKRMLSLEVVDMSEFEVKPRLIIDTVGEPTKINYEKTEKGVRVFLEVIIDKIKMLP